jgi:predicted regulator of Ras-like GTPase activity (Roadblock/LC7/MglB family)
VTDTVHRTAQRDMTQSGIARILELFFGGNHAVDAAVLFDSTGETVDYHAVLDPFETRLVAAYCGIIFESARYRMEWLKQGELQSLEFSTDKYDILTVPICEEFRLSLLVRKGALDSALLDTVSGVQEALQSEIGS